MMETQGREEVRDAVAIAVLAGLGAAIIDLACDMARDVWEEYRKARRKQQKQTKKKKKAH